MPDDSKLETIPVGSLGIVAHKSCTGLGEKVDHYLVKWRANRDNVHKDNIVFHAQSFFFSFSQASSTALPVTYVVDDAYEPESYGDASVSAPNTATSSTEQSIHSATI